MKSRHGFYILIALIFSVSTVFARSTGNISSALDELMPKLVDDCPEPSSQAAKNLRAFNAIKDSGEYRPQGDSMDLNKCYQADGKDRFAERVIIPNTKALLAKNPPPPVKKDDGTWASRDDWVRVDLLTRLLVGEIATSPKCSDEQVKAVAKVVLNRVDLVDQSNSRSWTQFATSREGDLLSNVVLKKSQFASFNGSDNANAWLACPASQIQQTYVIKGVTQTSGSSAYMLWARAHEVAYDAIMNGRKFRKDTAGVDNLFFTVGKEQHDAYIKSKRYAMNNGAHIKGVPVNGVNCVEIWNERTPDGAIKRADQYK